MGDSALGCSAGIGLTEMALPWVVPGLSTRSVTYLPTPSYRSPDLPTSTLCPPLRRTLIKPIFQKGRVFLCPQGHRGRPGLQGAGGGEGGPGTRMGGLGSRVSGRGHRGEGAGHRGGQAGLQGEWAGHRHGQAGLPRSWRHSASPGPSSLPADERPLAGAP